MPHALPALLIIDVQEAMDDPKWGRRNNPQLLANLTTALACWRRHRRPVFLIADDEPNPDSPYHPGKPGNAFKPEVAPAGADRVVRKTTGDAFASTNLEAMLRDAGVDALVVGGFMTNRCVADTVLSAARLGFRVTVLSDATAAVGEASGDGPWSEAEEVHRRTIEALRSKGIRIAETRDAVRGEGGPG